MKKGFTLIELSIVLVVIGLMIGGLLAANTLITSSKIQRQIKDLQQMSISVNNYYEAFNFYPGDSPLTAPAGDGDGLLAVNAGCIGTAAANENLQVFGQLSNAQMIDKTYLPYTPTSCSGSQPVTGTNANIQALCGIDYPCTDLDSTAQAAGYLNKYYYLAGRSSSADTFNFQFVTNVSYALGLESKLGTLVSHSGKKFGLYNTSNSGTAGYCQTGSGYALCTAANAKYGTFQYYIGI